MAAVHDRARGHRSLLPAGRTFPARPATLQFPAPVMAAGGADEAVGPALGCEMPGAGGFIGKARLEGGAGHRAVVLPAAGHDRTLSEHGGRGTRRSAGSAIRAAGGRRAPISWGSACRRAGRPRAHHRAGSTSKRLPRRRRRARATPNAIPRRSRRTRLLYVDPSVKIGDRVYTDPGVRYKQAIGQGANALLGVLSAPGGDAPDWLHRCALRRSARDMAAAKPDLDAEMSLTFTGYGPLERGDPATRADRRAPSSLAASGKLAWPGGTSSRRHLLRGN